MAILSSDGKSVTVQRGDTLSQIAQDHAGGASKYRQLAAINNIPNPNLIYVRQVIRLTNEGSSSTSSTTNSNKPTINQFGLQSNADDVLFATWTWSKNNTESYKVLWTYDTGDGLWFTGSNSTITVDKDAPEVSRQSTYSIPDNAKRVQFKVKPIAKSKTKNNSEVKYWEAEWSNVETYTDSTPLETPPVPSVEIKKYTLTATLDNLVIDATGIEFEVVKNNSATPYKTAKAVIVTGHASYSCNVDTSADYKVRCRAYKGSDYSDWSNYSNNMGTMPAATSGITAISATSKTSVYLEWTAVETATSYDIEYANKLSHFDASDQTTIKSGIETNHYEVTGLELGVESEGESETVVNNEYFFRVRAVNSDGTSIWCEPRSVVIGEKPSAPTTWSSTTTVITGEPLTLYWVHNAADGSSQTYAELEITIGETTETRTIQNTSDKDERDKTSRLAINTSEYVEGTIIKWRVRTAGATLEYGEWSVERIINVYAPPTQELKLMDRYGVLIRTITEFPFRITSLPGPNTQAPIGYHLTITSNDMYETVDNIGNVKIVNSGEIIYSRYINVERSLNGVDIRALDINLTASDIDLRNNVNYTLTCLVSMNSGLTEESSLNFDVAWTDVSYTPNAEIGIDTDTFTVSIRPYCNEYAYAYHRVEIIDGQYTVMLDTVEGVWGEIVPGVVTTTGELVYSGVTANGDEVHYCLVETEMSVDDVFLSVYRREFDGSFTELITGLDGAKNTTITDPHPALDFARYRIVATSKETGAVSYYDPPGVPVGGVAVIIQWDEAWTSFETNEESALEQPPWSGSMLKLPYNIDVSDNHKSDVVLVEYIGRSHPISYYGTQLGESSTWNMVIEKSDKETLYALRRLARWLGDVYVREPSGSGYWANVTVSFSQKHCDVTIPVSLDIVRVEGGV